MYRVTQTILPWPIHYDRVGVCKMHSDFKELRKIGRSAKLFGEAADFFWCGEIFDANQVEPEIS